MSELSSISSKRHEQLLLSGLKRTATSGEVESKPIARPFVKWAGGKSRLCPIYRGKGLLPNFEGTYFEGFLGGGALFFHLQPKQAVLIDSNEELVTTYKVVKSQVHRLIEELREHEARHRVDGARYYYAVRAARPSKAIDRAARFIYLNRTCYNGLYRVNSAGEFNVPMGEYKNPRIVDAEGLKAASRALRTATIRCGDYQDVESLVSRGDLAYFDPPYDKLPGKSSFTAYTKDEFGPLDQVSLRDLFVRLAANGVKSLVSNSDTPLIRELYDDWWVHEIRATRAINSDPAGRRSIVELAVSNFKPASMESLDSFQ